MTVSHNYIADYESALEVLSRHSDSIEAKHAAVLALVRAGSLDLAILEYERYGLDTIRHHEDIQALGGRLYKDLAFRGSGKARADIAQQSSEKYEQAFQDTGGYYSGVNAATMALVAGVPNESIRARAETILDQLPLSASLEPESKYFIEATRAECHLLRGEDTLAEAGLRIAFGHDPLNYTAHASTLKQFRMILSLQDQPSEWLSLFNPPKTVHFAGHMFTLDQRAGASLSISQEEALKIAVSDRIQIEDIGFGFGALAAGSDIVIAEALIENGAGLNVVLPSEIDDFYEHSVKPFGTNWAGRFHALLAKADSIHITGSTVPWPFETRLRLSSRVAMGLATMQAETLDAPSVQLAIWDGIPSQSLTGTAQDAQHWKNSGRDQMIIPFPVKRQAVSVKAADTVDVEIFTMITLVLSEPPSPELLRRLLAQGFSSRSKTPLVYKARFKQADKAVKAAAKFVDKTIRLFLDFSQECRGISASQTSSGEQICEITLPGVIYTSQDVAAVLHAMYKDKFSISYSGIIEPADQAFRIYAVHL